MTEKRSAQHDNKNGKREWKGEKDLLAAEEKRKRRGTKGSSSQSSICTETMLRPVPWPLSSYGAASEFVEAPSLYRQTPMWRRRSNDEGGFLALQRLKQGHLHLQGETETLFRDGPELNCLAEQVHQVNGHGEQAHWPSPLSLQLLLVSITAQ